MVDERQQPPPVPPDAVRIVPVAKPLVPRIRIAHARNFSAAVRPYSRNVVLHTVECRPSTHADDDVAAMFADANLKTPEGQKIVRRSAHYVVDADSATCCVPEALTAWHCGKHGNAIGIGVEIAARAAQTRAEWLSGDSLRTLCVAARLVADICKRNRIPVQNVTSAGLRAGTPGITTHYAVGGAWGETSHTDPGPSFPLGDFIAAVVLAMAG